jgi:hypothetical protein
MASSLVKRIVGIAFVAMVAAPLAAQLPADPSKMSDAELKAALTFGELKIGTISQPFFRGSPGMSSGSPSGFGAGWRDAYVGGGYQQVRGGGQADGSIAAGMGFGSAKDAVGLEMSVASLSTFRSGLFDRTAFSFKAHHMVSNSASLAVGVENAMVTGGHTDGVSSVFVAGTKVMSFPESWFKQVTFSGGIGNGRFRFEKDALKKKETVNMFASVGAQFHEQASVFADWAGQDLALGLSVVPIKAFPIILTPAIADVTGQNGRSARFTLGFGIGMKF